MILIDTHAHLYLEEFGTEIPELLERAEKAGVKRFYLPAIDSSEHSRMMSLEAEYPDKCLAMM